MDHPVLRFLAVFIYTVLATVPSLWADGDTGNASLERMELLDNERALAVGDRLVYQVTEEREDPIPLFVDSRGMVDFPLIGELQGEGKTAYTLAHEVKTELEKDFFYRATVLIRLQTGTNTRGKVNLVGAMRRQGQFPIPSDDILTVSRLVLEAGGLPPEADGKKVRLVRHSEDSSEPQEIILDVETMLQTGDFSQDVPVQRGDLVVVPERASVGGQYIVDGAVNNPGLYSMPNDRNFTVSKAILRCGGFSRFANQRTVQLIRADTNIPADERTITVNVREILENNRLDLDPEVQPNDIIRVDEKLINF